MTREHTILMLLAAGPASHGQLVQDTGWGIVETRAVVDGLMSAGQVVRFPAAGGNQFQPKQVCLPEAREEALQQRRAIRAQQVLAAVRRHRARSNGAWA